MNKHLELSRRQVYYLRGGPDLRESGEETPAGVVPDSPSRLLTPNQEAK